jgi:hypothetical protein
MFRLALVCEGPTDFRAISRLADRVACENVDWLRDTLEQVRVWIGAREGAKFLSWTSIEEESVAAKAPRTLGRFSGEPGIVHAAATRKALVLFKSMTTPPDAVVLAADVGDAPGRRKGMAQARDANAWPWGAATILETPDRELEAWELAGFIAADDKEKELIEARRKLLGFNPCVEAHKLRHTHGEERDPKRVLDELCQDSFERRLECAEADLDTLKNRGRHSGLMDFLKEVEIRLVPVFTK